MAMQAVEPQRRAAADHKPCAATTAPPAAGSEQWVQDTCRVSLDAEGHVLTHIPALLACAVGRLVEATEASGGDAPYQPTRLHGCRPPGISLDAYAQRLLRYCKCSPVCYAAAFAYMRRLHTGTGGVQGGQLRVGSLTAHRLMAVGIIVATKFFDDKYYSNAHYAQVAGVSLREWNAMELDMLFRLNFRARVDLRELGEALQEMEALAFGQATGLSATLTLRPAPAAGHHNQLHAHAEDEVQSAGISTAGAPAASASVSVDMEREEGDEDDASCDTAITMRSAASCDTAITMGSAASCDVEEAVAAACCAASCQPGGAAVPLPWAAVGTGAGEEDERTATPRRSNKRGSSVVVARLLATLQHQQQEEQQHRAGTAEVQVEA